MYHFITLSSRTSREYLSCAGFTVGTSICTHHTVALCNRQVIVVVISLLLPELWPLGSFLFCPRITSLKFLSCSPCSAPPFELHSGGAVVPTIASLMSWFSNPKFRGINLTDILWRFLTTSACFLYSSRDFQGQGWFQPGGIEVSNLYRNAVWALQAGNSGEALTFKHYTHKWGFGRKVIFSSDLHLSFGCKFAEFESCPSCFSGRKHPGAWAPILVKFLCVLMAKLWWSWAISDHTTYRPSWGKWGKDCYRQSWGNQEIVYIILYL